MKKLWKNTKGLALNTSTVVGAFVGLIVFTAIVAAMGDDVLTNITTLNGTFAATGIGTLFGATIAGLLLAVGIFMVIRGDGTNPSRLAV